MTNKKSKELDGVQNNPNGLLRFMAEQQVKTNNRLAYITALLAAGGAVSLALLLFILDKVTGG